MGIRTSANIIARIRDFAKAEPIFCIALIIALISMIAVPPCAAYAGYIKWNTLALLSMFMLCVAGLQEAGFLQNLAQGLLARAARAGKRRLLALIGTLVALPYFAAMFISNDVALLSFVPFALLLLKQENLQRLIPLVLSMQTIAANAGSYLTPFGNPHNLLSYSLFNVSATDFMLSQAPLSLISAFVLGLSVLIFVPKSSEKPSIEDTSACVSGSNTDVLPPVDSRAAIFYATLFIISVLAVLRLIPLFAAFALIVIAVAIKDYRLFAKVDYLLLGTFVCFFIFSSNMAAIPAISNALTGAMASQPFWVTALSSQVISNVPACTLLAPFTNDWCALATGANVGGYGSPVGSLAGLITLGFYRRSADAPLAPYLKVYLGLNVFFFCLGCLIWLVF